MGSLKIGSPLLVESFSLNGTAERRKRSEFRMINYRFWELRRFKVFGTPCFIRSKL